MNYFAVLVDGEVALNMELPELVMGKYDGAKIAAVLSSNPIFIKTDENIEEGSTWDGSTFTPPVI